MQFSSEVKHIFHQQLKTQEIRALIEQDNPYNRCGDDELACIIWKDHSWAAKKDICVFI